MVHIVAESFLTRYADELTAGATLVAAGLLIVLVHRTIRRRGRRIAGLMSRGDLSREADTRLRFLRRVIDAVIVIIGLALALSQFTALDRVASAVLASGAIAAAVVGFAARQVLANAVAGVMLAVTQPLRIGDHIAFEGETGEVEDVRLTSTWLRTATGARLVVPNERLVAGVLRNDSIVMATVVVEVSVWLAPDADEGRALSALRDLGVQARVTEVTDGGIRLTVSGDAVAPAERAAREAELRERSLGALRACGVR